MTVTQQAIGMRGSAAHSVGRPATAAAPPVPPTFVQQLGVFNIATAITVIPVPITVQSAAGHQAIVVAAVGNARIISSVTDTQGNTWAVDFTASGTGPNVVFARAPLGVALSPGDTVTVTLNASSTGAGVQVLECAGINARDWTATSGPVAAATCTVTTAGPVNQAELSITGAANNLTTNPWVPPAGWTDSPNPGKGDVATQNTASGNTPSAQWTATGATAIIAGIVTYK